MLGPCAPLVFRVLGGKQRDSRAGVGHLDVEGTGRQRTVQGHVQVHVRVGPSVGIQSPSRCLHGSSHARLDGSLRFSMRFPCLLDDHNFLIFCCTNFFLPKKKQRKKQVDEPYQPATPTVVSFNRLSELIGSTTVVYTQPPLPTINQHR